MIILHILIVSICLSICIPLFYIIIKTLIFKSKLYRLRYINNVVISLDGELYIKKSEHHRVVNMIE
jgi:hypothetical protein